MDAETEAGRLREAKGSAWGSQPARNSGDVSLGLGTRPCVQLSGHESSPAVGGVGVEWGCGEGISGSRTAQAKAGRREGTRTLGGLGRSECSGSTEQNRESSFPFGEKRPWDEARATQVHKRQSPKCDGKFLPLPAPRLHAII